MIFLLCSTATQARYYMRTLFPEENPNTSKVVRAVTPDNPNVVRGFHDAHAIMVGTFRGDSEREQVLIQCLTPGLVEGTRPIQGPRNGFGT